MTRDEIIKLAREAGGVFDGGCWRLNAEFDEDDLSRFAALVAAAERDRVCKIVYGLCISDNNAFEIVQAIKAVTEKGASNHDAERNDSTG